MKPRPTPPYLPRIRMYRQGPGECILATLPGASGTPFHMLLDCGLHAGAPDEAGVMERVALDVEAATGGRLDVVALSHDQWDRVSGFALARPVFDRIAIGEVWLGWAEDPVDLRAQALARRRERDLRGLRVLANRLNRAGRRGGGSDPVAMQLDVALGSFGPRGGAAARQAVEYLKDHPSRPRVCYRRPGGPAVRLAGSPGAAAYILGPSGDTACSDRSLSASLALFAAAGGLAADDDEAASLGDAFDARYRISPERAERHPFFRERYLLEAETWRRIDRDWMGAGVSLALDLDERCKTLSLALAIEVEPGGPVLLFPGDAQAEEWAAWARLRWPPRGHADAHMTGRDLLERTVFYKVGRRRAAGTTPGPEVLDLMTSPDLVAMLVVDEESAVQARWSMPEPASLERLLRATRGRLLRSDRPFPERPKGVAAGDWEAFRRSVAFDPDGLYVDLYVGM